MLRLSEKLLISINVIASFSCVMLFIKFIIAPFAVNQIYASEYKEKMFICDSAMRNHMIAKNRVTVEKSIESIKALEKAEVSLVHCHDYDKLRKFMISWGASSNDLARLGLEAIEENSADIDKFIEIHEFKF